MFLYFENQFSVEHIQSSEEEIQKSEELNSNLPDHLENSKFSQKSRNQKNQEIH
jgi:hypothetical protein